MKAGCPHCGAQEEYADDLAGLNIPCRKCDERFRVPSAVKAEQPKRKRRGWTRPPRRSAIIIGCGLLGVIVVGVVGYIVYRDRQELNQAVARRQLMIRALKPWVSPGRSLDLLCCEVNKSRVDHGCTLAEALDVQIAVEQHGMPEFRDALADYTVATALAIEATRDATGDQAAKYPAYFDLSFLPSSMVDTGAEVAVEGYKVKTDFRGHFIVWKTRAKTRLTKRECRAAAWRVLRKSPPTCHYTQFWVSVLPPDERCIQNLYSLQVQAPGSQLWRPYTQYRIESEHYWPEMLDPPEWALE